MTFIYSEGVISTHIGELVQMRYFSRK